LVIATIPSRAANLVCQCYILKYRENFKLPTLTKEIIEAAIAGLEGHRKHIDGQIAELRAILTGDGSSPAAAPKSGKTKRKFSASALKRMREAQQRRWAKVRGEAVTMPKPVKPKGTLSAAGRKAIAEAQKKRWAEKKAARAT
jgi:hypothetical protein